VATSSPPLPTDAQTDTCPRCFGTVQQTAVEHVCPECGLVVDESPIDHGPEWRHFEDSDENPERAAPGNPNRADRGLGSKRHTRNGTHADSRQDHLHRRVRSGDKKDRNREWVTQEIQRMASAVSLPDHVSERARYVFRRLHEQNLEGKNLDVVGAACLYAACREHGMGRTPDELAAVARCEERPIRRRVWWIADELGLELPPPDVRQRIRVVASKLPTDENATQQAVERVKSVDGAQAASGSPSTLAAWLLWESGECNQAQVAQAAGVTPTGLRKRRDALAE